MFNFLYPKNDTAYKLPQGGYIDPLVVYQALLRGGIAKLIDKHSAGDPSRETESKICALIRQCFTLPDLCRVSGRGYTEQQCTALYQDFMSHLEKKGLRGRTTRTIVPATVPPQTPQDVRDFGST